MKKTALAFILVLSACSQNQQASVQPALDTINADSLLSEIKTLSSDDFEGRKPGSPGEQKAIAYMQQQFQQMALKPGNPDGSWLQNVPLAGITSKTQPVFSAKGKKLALTVNKDIVALSSRYVPHVDVSNSDIVFVGYGVVAPEYKWDDYKGVDVKGKTILMLIKGRVSVEGWITYDKAAELCRMAGLDLAALKKAAIMKDFKPVPLPGAKGSFKVENTLRKIDSHNVIAKMEGSDAALKDQYVIYTAHWDHLGRDPELKGDQIYNGAADNASGSAGLLELARAYSKLSPAPKRSILFLSVTAEEQGLLGAKYYAANPLYPLKNTLADINMDVLNTWGRTKDMTLIGMGNSTLDDTAAAVLKTHDRTVAGDPDPGKGSFYRSDHFEFAKQGVPALDPDPGTQYIGKPADYGKQKRDNYTANDYHKPSDEVKPDWDLSGAVDDLRAFFEIGYDVAQADKFPEWKPGTEFKAKRDEMMK
jgi:Zn-dependent M28 family amino/carboxypeptidase